MQAGGGFRNRSRFFREYGLIPLAVRQFVFAFDVRWQRNMAEPLEVFRRRFVVPAGKPQGAQSELATRNYFSFQLASAERDLFSYSHFSARPDQRFPSVRLDFAGQKDLHGSGKVLPGGRSGRRLRMRSEPPAKEPRRNNTSVVKHQKLVAAQQIR